MPLTLTLTEGLLPPGREQSTFVRLCEAMLKWHGLSGNRALTPNVIGSVRVLRANETFSGLEPGPIAVVEWIVPSFAFASREIQAGYVAEATEIVHEASGGRHPKERIWCAVLHAVDGTWGIGGQAFTNAELAQRVSQG
jgi:hypothetical protein